MEAKTKNNWYQSIIDLIDFSEVSGFSEYETLGTFALRYFDSEIKINENTDNWYRWGNGLIGGAQNIEKYKSLFSSKYHFISFESIDDMPISIMRRYIQLNLLMRMHLLKNKPFESLFIR